MSLRHRKASITLIIYLTSLLCDHRHLVLSCYHLKKMHLLSLQAAIIVSQLCSPVFAFSESCQQLIKNLRIEDQATVNLVQNACQSSSNDSSADQARTACRIARHVFQGVSPSVPDLPEYIDPQSTFYDNRTESSWSVEQDSA